MTTVPPLFIKQIHLPSFNAVNDQHSHFQLAPVISSDKGVLVPNLRFPQLSPGSPSLGMDVEELAEDCCEVRSQLEHLQRLLLQVRRGQAAPPLGDKS